MLRDNPAKISISEIRKCVSKHSGFTIKSVQHFHEMVQAPIAHQCFVGILKRSDAGIEVVWLDYDNQAAQIAGNENNYRLAMLSELKKHRDIQGVIADNLSYFWISPPILPGDQIREYWLINKSDGALQKLPESGVLVELSNILRQPLPLKKLPARLDGSPSLSSVVPVPLQEEKNKNDQNSNLVAPVSNFHFDQFSFNKKNLDFSPAELLHDRIQKEPSECFLGIMDISKLNEGKGNKTVDVVWQSYTSQGEDLAADAGDAFRNSKFVELSAKAFAGTTRNPEDLIYFLVSDAVSANGQTRTWLITNEGGKKKKLEDEFGECLLTKLFNFLMLPLKKLEHKSSSSSSLVVLSGSESESESESGPVSVVSSSSPLSVPAAVEKEEKADQEKPLGQSSSYFSNLPVIFNLFCNKNTAIAAILFLVGGGFCGAAAFYLLAASAPVSLGIGGVFGTALGGSFLLFGPGKSTNANNALPPSVSPRL